MGQYVSVGLLMLTHGYEYPYLVLARGARVRNEYLRLSQGRTSRRNRFQRTHHGAPRMILEAGMPSCKNWFTPSSATLSQKTARAVM